MQRNGISPQAEMERKEAFRSAAADFQAVFSSPEGQRVLKYLKQHVLLAGCTLHRNHANVELSGNDALYLLGRQDAARIIDNLMEYNFVEPARPVVRTSRYEPRREPAKAE